ncbi:MAG: hypothetical protein M3081_14230 [Gemmatimonadota bacterium]|nr:hypothetical protein [Gemmatimonadota bacterium]
MAAEHDAYEEGDDMHHLFDALPRESVIAAGQEDDLVRALRAEGFLRRQRTTLRWPLQIAAAIVLLLVGALAGERIAGRQSLESEIARRDLSVADRVLLLQRAGSAYVQAANAYAAATAQTDSTAVEVASQVLLGAAHAVARHHLDGGLAPRLTAELQSPFAARTRSPQRIVWY